MGLKHISNSSVGVIGAGRFGTAIANLLAKNTDVLLYIRNAVNAKQINQIRVAAGQKLAKNIKITCSLEELTHHCTVLFPIIPSQGIRELLTLLAPLLLPSHMIIHGIKGLDTDLNTENKKNFLNTSLKLSRNQVKTMSELISATTQVNQIGCIAGPNLAMELAEGHPAAIVIASHYKSVIAMGQVLLRSKHFQVYTNTDIIGVELCGALKNIIAIGAGCLAGLGYGENAKALLISRGLTEMVHIGKAMGSSVKPFLGLAGIGDLVATCTSTLSRNYTVGYQLAQGEPLAAILHSGITAEGVYTVKVIRGLMAHYNMRAPITEMVYRILFEGLSVQKAINYLMKYPLNVDVDFI